MSVLSERSSQREERLFRERSFFERSSVERERPFRERGRFERDGRFKILFRDVFLDLFRR